MVPQVTRNPLIQAASMKDLLTFLHLSKRLLQSPKSSRDSEVELGYL